MAMTVLYSGALLLGTCCHYSLVGNFSEFTLESWLIDGHEGSLWLVVGHSVMSYKLVAAVGYGRRLSCSSRPHDNLWDMREGGGEKI